MRARRGDPGADEILDEALAIAAQTDTLLRLAPVRAARAEAAWLAGDPCRTVTEASAAYELAIRYRHRWYAGELIHWRRLGGDVTDWERGAMLPRAYTLTVDVGDPAHKHVPSIRVPRRIAYSGRL